MVGGQSGDLYTLMSDAGPVTAVREDFIVTRDQHPPHALFPMRKTYPYGAYHCANGDRVMFNRDYEPILRIRADGSRESCDPKEWIEHDHARQEWFYGDINAPWREKAIARQCRQMLQEAA